LDPRYTLVLDYLERAAAVLASIAEGPVEIENVLRHTASIIRLQIDAESVDRTVLDLAKYRRARL